MAFAAKEVKLSEKMRQHLRQIINGQKTEVRLARRAAIALYVSDGRSNAWIAKELRISADTISKWRSRIAEQAERLHKIESEAPERLASELQAVLGDAPRSGRPAIFTGDQIAWIMNRACQKPSACGHERRRWTGEMLAEDAVTNDIVDSISPRTVYRYLHAADIKPWRIEYWMHSPDKDENPAEFMRRVGVLGNLYLSARELIEQGIHLVCVDEKTGIQALRDKHPARLVSPGHAERKEFEYSREGTLTLMAGLEVSSGTILPERIGKTRTEVDFVAFIKKIVATDPNAEWIFVADGLNTHKSETLVRFVAEACGIDEDLGGKGKQGILKNMESRAEFLESPEHRIRFAFTPRHSSWMNQIEIWFGTLSRQLLSERSYVSTKALDASIRKYIRQYNVTAMPYKWTYTGMPLAA